MNQIKKEDIRTLNNDLFILIEANDANEKLQFVTC